MRHLLTDPAVCAEALDLMIEARGFTDHHYPLPIYDNPFLDDLELRLVDPRDARQAEAVRKEVEGRLTHQRQLKLKGGAFITQREHHRVSKEDVIEAREFKPHAASVPWPDVFVMEASRDRRKTHTLEQNNGRARHAIDWYREESSVSDILPNLRKPDDPYGGTPSDAARISKATWETLKSLRRNLLNNIADDALARAGLTMAERKKAWARSAVRDTLRDLTLFGLVINGMDEKNNPIFSIAADVVQQD